MTKVEVLALLVWAVIVAAIIAHDPSVLDSVGGF